MNQSIQVILHQFHKILAVVNFNSKVLMKLIKPVNGCDVMPPFCKLSSSLISLQASFCLIFWLLMLCFMCLKAG